MAPSSAHVARGPDQSWGSTAYLFLEMKVGFTSGTSAPSSAGGLGAGLVGTISVPLPGVQRLDGVFSVLLSTVGATPIVPLSPGLSRALVR